MRVKDVLLIVQSVLFASLAGMRSLSPLALLSLFLSRKQPRGNAVAEQLVSPPVVATLAALALAEMAADKLPQAPDRTFPPALVFRSLTGGGATAVLWSLAGRPAWIGGLLGAVAAVLNTFVSFRIRMWLSDALPSKFAISWVGVLEDVALWVSGWGLLSSFGVGNTAEHHGALREDSSS